MLFESGWYGKGLVLLSIVLLAGCVSPPPGPGGRTPPSFAVVVDARLKATSRPLPPFPDGAVRPLATLTDKSGRQTDFVENELLIEFATPQELDAFLARWHGTVLAQDPPRTAGIAANPTYLVRVATQGADLSTASEQLSSLNPHGGSAIKVSSLAAQQLIAIGADTAAAGRHVGLNFLTRSAGFQNEQLAEAPKGSSAMVDNGGAVVESWNPNPFQWVYMKRGGRLDIGVAAAWSLLDRVGAFSHKVKIAVVDGGFGGGDDFPTPYELNKASLAALDPSGPNELDCGGAECRWHGWNVVNAAMGQVDNGIGAAGPAGPVAQLLAIRRSADVFNAIQSITLALSSGADIINMSWVIRVPALLSWSMVPFDLATLRAHGAGKLLFAAAGNDAEDINEEDCFVFCWEAAWIAPCENGGVICVGAMDAGAPYRRTSSNYGGTDLDIWGPGSLWVSGDFDNDLPHVFTATSASTPFVAGVAALIWAARPGLDNDGVERILYETAHQGQPGEVERWPNAYAAVVRALGGTPPEISIDVTSSPLFGACQTRFDFTAQVADPDGGAPVVTWTSDIDGVLGTGNFLSRALSDGTHHITATAMDGTGLAARSNEVVQVVSNATTANAPRPTLSILSPVNHQVVAANQPVTFESAGSDPANSLGALVSANLSWSSSKDGILGKGQRIFHTLSPGSHYITASYTGVCGVGADDLRLVEVTKAVADTPPNMVITTPSGNDLVLRTDTTGQACLRVAGFGFDEQDRDFAIIDWWETNRSDVQWKVLSFDQNTTVCLRLVPNAVSTVHEVRLRGTDRTGHHAYSAPLRVTVLPGLR